MNTIIQWLEEVVGALPLPLLEVWGRFAYVVGFALALWAFGGFTFRPGGHWGLGRERQAWDAKAVLSIPLTFILIIVSGYLGSFIVLVPGAQTLESLKDLMVFLCIVLFGYPALIMVPFAYGLSDLIEGVPPEFLLDWLPGYFINPSCFWLAYQFIGRHPDFRRARTWGMYLLFVLIFMAIEPVLWGYICSGKFTSAISYRHITSALFFTTGLTWLIAPIAMLAAFPLARKSGMFWAEIPGHVKERLLGHADWIWESGGGDVRPDSGALTATWPIRMILLTPFIGLILLMVGATAYVTLRSAEEDANKLATRLHWEISDNINLKLDDYLTKAQADEGQIKGINSLLKSLPVAQHGLALIIDRSGKAIASSADAGDPVAAKAVAGLDETHASRELLKAGLQFQFDHVTVKPLSRSTWMARATAYQDRQGGHADWIVVTVMPESYYLAGVKAGNSRSALIFALALVLSLLVAALLAALVTRRLQQTSLATQALAQGDLTQRVPGSRIEELDTLSRSFNNMAEQLKKSFDDLRIEVETRKRRERELEESEARWRMSENRLQLAVKAASFAIWDWDVEKNQLHWDESMYQLYGTSKAEFGGTYEAWRRCLASDDYAQVTSDVDAALRGEREFASEFRVRLKDGSVRFIRGVAKTIRSDDGRPLRMVGINWDVTEQLLAEQTLRERETFLRITQEAAHVGSWEWDIPRNRFKWSDELARIHGITGAEFDGKLETVMSFCHPRDLERLGEAMRQIGAGTNLDGFECRIVRRDGVERDVWFLGRIHRDERGAPAKVLGIGIDITERKRRDLLLAEETRILGMIAGGAPLTEILTAIVLGIETIAKDTIGSILLLDPDGVHMRHGTAPNLPEAYNRAVDGAAIGPQTGSCGTSLYRREPVIVSDIETDPLWEGQRELARMHGLRACWSTPILNGRGTALGSFAMYYWEPRSPSADDLVLIRRATHLAGVALERQQSEKENRKLLHTLGERVKELTCLRKTADILRDDRQSTAGLLAELALILPQGWEHPAETAVRIRLGELEYAGPGFVKTPWLLCAEFVDAVGTPCAIEVVYLSERPAQAEGPFLAEERQLINSVAEMLRSALNRRWAEETLREEKRFIDTLMDSLPGVVFLFTATGKYIKWNKVMEQVSGYSSTEIARLTPLDFFAAEDADAVTKAIQVVLSSGQHTIESHLLTKIRQSIPYYFKGVRLTTDEGPCVLGMGIDLTDRRRLEDQFHQAQKMEAVGHLAAGVAHDFNNLLTIISGYSEILLSTLPPADPKREGLKAIHQAGERAASLTQQLLAFSRQSVLQPKVLDINSIVKETEKMLRRVIGEDVMLSVVVDTKISRIKVDPGQLGQVLMNLSVNARDAMPKGGKLTIETRGVRIDEDYCKLHPYAKPGSYVQLATSDTGCGMTPDIQARIFEPFFTTKGVGKGTGLGLAMVYGIVKQSGGHIEVYSEVGIGTTFKLYFPAVNEKATFQPNDTFAIPIRHGTETILLVEDEAGVRGLSLLALQTYGYQVLVAADGKNALRIVSENGKPIDMLVTDVVMPGMSGRELAESLRRQIPNLRVLYVSGYTDDAVVRHGLLQETVDFLQKPFTPTMLAKKVREVLDAPQCER